MTSRSAEAGFTLLELIVAMAVFALVGLGIFGVLVLGARSAGSGEKITEQARRYRVANEILSRQIAGTVSLCLPKHSGGDELGSDSSGPGAGDPDSLDDDEEDDDEEGGGSTTTEPYFFGNSDTVEFITTAPQRPDASGMSIVRYWVEDNALKMSEKPVFAAYGHSKKLDRKKTNSDESVTATLLYDVASVTFSYLRESDSDDWLDAWDANDENQLPATVRIDVKPSASGGPDFYHEVPVMMGAFNQIVDSDSNDFNCTGTGSKHKTPASTIPPP